MRVLVVPADVHGCGHYRLIYFAEHLQGLGHDIVIQWPKGKDSGLQIKVRDDTPVDVEIPLGADVIVLQRVSHRWHSQVISLLREKGVAVVIDMDDDLTCIHRSNIAYLNYHPRSNTPYSWKNAEVACKAATLVTLSTQTLVQVYGYGHGHVIDNYIPERHLDTGHEQDPVWGWPGTTASHPGDLQTMGRAGQDLIDAGYPMRVVGPPSKVKEALRLREHPEYTGIVPGADWINAMSRLSVVVAPLENSRFNSGKSRLKVLEASAGGRPWVASPRTEYRRFHKESGAGLLADSSKDWFKAVKQLMDDETMRKELGERGREYVRTQTIEANSWRALEAWERAYNMQRGKES